MQKIIEKLKSVDKGTIIRTAALIVSILNNVAAVIATVAGADCAAYLIISTVATVASALIAGWENNDWTDFAIVMGKVWKAVKSGKVEQEKVEKLLEEKPSKGTGRNNKVNEVK